jgi:hypothetical protein
MQAQQREAIVAMTMQRTIRVAPPSSRRACGGIELIVPSLQQRVSRNVCNITMHVRCASDRKDERTWTFIFQQRFELFSSIPITAATASAP